METQECLPLIYDSYEKVLSDILNCQCKDQKPLVQFYTSVVTNHVLWKDDIRTSSQLSGIHFYFRRFVYAIGR